jgi:hypothetical protein
LTKVIGLRLPEARQETRRPPTLRGFREDRVLVGFENRKPRRQILRVIRARHVGDAEIGAKERGT